MREEAKSFLAGLLRISINDLEEALRAKDGYVLRRMKKLGGGYRHLAIPPKQLRNVQRRILNNIIRHIPITPGRFHGFTRKHSIVSNAKQHLEHKLDYVLTLDLENAFGNVNESWFKEKIVENFLDSLRTLHAIRRFRKERSVHLRFAHCPRYDPDTFEKLFCRECERLAEEAKRLDDAMFEHTFRVRDVAQALWKIDHSRRLVSLFREWLRSIRGTGIPAMPRQLPLFSAFYQRQLEPLQFEMLLRHMLELLAELCFYNGSLPQGAPTSPYLLNLALCYSGLPTRLNHLSNDLADAEGLKRLPETLKQIEKWAMIPGWKKWRMMPVWRGIWAFEFSFYADDITFSSPYSFGDRPFAPKDERTMKEVIIDTIEASGPFKVNRRKIRTYNWHSEYPLVTGLRLAPRGIALSKQRIRWLRSFLHHAYNDPERQAEVKGHLAYLVMVYGGKDRFPRQLFKS